MFEKVSITIHKQPENKLVLHKILLCCCSAVISKRGDDRTSRWYRAERDWGARSKCFKKEKRKIKRTKIPTKQNKSSELFELNYLDSGFSVRGCFWFQLTFGEMVVVSCMLAAVVPSLSNAGVPFQLAADPPCTAELAALSGHISRAAPSRCLFLVILGGTGQKQWVCVSSSQCLLHQHGVEINIAIPAGVWQLACSLLPLETRKSRMSFPGWAEADKL